MKILNVLTIVSMLMMMSCQQDVEGPAPQSTFAISEHCLNIEASVNCRYVCDNHTCSNNCGVCNYQTAPDITNSRLLSGGESCPPWQSQIDQVRWYNCTNVQPSKDICINDFVDSGKSFKEVACTTLANVRTCCGQEYINSVCPKATDETATSCDCYNCAVEQ